MPGTGRHHPQHPCRRHHHRVDRACRSRAARRGGASGGAELRTQDRGGRPARRDEFARGAGRSIWASKPDGAARNPRTEIVLWRLPGAVWHRHDAGRERDRGDHRRQRRRQIDLSEVDRGTDPQRTRHGDVRWPADRRDARGLGDEARHIAGARGPASFSFADGRGKSSDRPLRAADAGAVDARGNLPVIPGAA